MTAIAAIPIEFRPIATAGFHIGASLNGPSVKSCATSLKAVYSYPSALPVANRPPQLTKIPAENELSTPTEMSSAVPL